jgi:NAD(P)-dependent dehydrogenase (short-subunit alcohol dehydrogenase family)
MRECVDLARRVAARGPLDVLVNCAGVFMTRRRVTPEGIETQFAVNHLAPFLLTTRLLPSLEASGEGRIIVISSDSHRPGRIHWADPGLGRFYFGLGAYEQSKLANVLFVKELARRLGMGSPVTAFALDPGLVDTAMGNKAGPSPSSLVWSLRRRAGTPAAVPAASIARLSADPGFRGRSGLYWKEGREVEPSPRAKNSVDARRLWDLSVRLVARALGEE